MTFNRCLACMQEIVPSQNVCPHCNSRIPCAPNPPDCLQPGDILPRASGRYVIGRVITRGEFGITYIAYDTLSQAVRCVKEYFPKSCKRRADMTPDIGRGKEAHFKKISDRFLQEARIMSDLSEKRVPHVAQVYDQLAENNTHYIVMEYLNGCTMDEYVKAHGGLGMEEARSAMTAVLETIGAIHQLGYLHRDISLNNIFRLTDGSVCLIGFGSAEPIAKARNHPRGISRFSRKYYSPPEQARQKSQGEWTDTYAAGMCMFKLVAGEFPKALRSGQALPPLRALGCSVSSSFDTVIRKAVQREPGKRYASAEDMLGDLLMIPPLPLTPADTLPDDQKPDDRKRSKMPLWLLVCIGIALIALILYLILHAIGPETTEKTTNTVGQYTAEPTAENSTPGQQPVSTPFAISAAPTDLETPAPTPVPTPVRTATPVPTIEPTAVMTPAPTAPPTAVPVLSAADLGLRYRIVSPGCIEITDYTNRMPADLVIPEILDGYTVVSIGKQAFDCGSSAKPRNPVLTSIVLPDTVHTIGESAFSYNKLLQRVTLPRNLTVIENDAFSWCICVREFDLPDTLTRIGNYAFDRCHSLESISIPDTVTRIGYSAFSVCTSLKTVKLPSRLNTIQNKMFTDCTSLEQIELPSMIKKIGVRAFYHCASLTSVSIPGAVAEIGEEAFGNCPRITVTVSGGSYAERYCRRNGIAYTIGD